MKRYKHNAVLICCLFVLQGCYTQLDLPEAKTPEPTVSKEPAVKPIPYPQPKDIWVDSLLFKGVIEDHSRGYDFNDGIYFEIDWDLYPHRNYWQGIAWEIERLVVWDFRFTDVWFKHHSGSCWPPGQSYSSPMVVPQRFIVRFTEYPDDIEDFRYKPVEDLDISCGYRVVHYWKTN